MLVDSFHLRRPADRHGSRVTYELLRYADGRWGVDHLDHDDRLLWSWQHESEAAARAAFEGARGR